MKFSELISEYMDLRMQGEPRSDKWTSIIEDDKNRRDYYSRIGHLLACMDKIIDGELS